MTVSALEPRRRSRIPGSRSAASPADQLGWVGPYRRECRVEPFEPLGLVRPDERPEPERMIFRGHVEGAQVDPGPRSDLGAEVEERRRNGALLPAAQVQPGARVAPAAGRVRVAIPVPDEVESRGRADLHEVEGRRPGAARSFEEAGQEHPAPLHLVRLNAAIGDPVPQEVPLRDERVLDIVPGGAPREHQVVKAGRKAKRRVPGGIRPDDRPDARVARELAPQPGIERRAPLRELRLLQEDVRLIAHRRPERTPVARTGRLRYRLRRP